MKPNAHTAGRLRPRPSLTVALLASGIAMVLALVGCGVSSDDVTAKTTTPKTTAPVTTTTAAPDTTTTSTSGPGGGGDPQAKAGSSVLIEGDLAGYTGEGGITTDPNDDSPLLDCFGDLQVADRTVGYAAGPTLSSSDGKVQFDTSTRTFDSEEFATQVATALDDKETASCLTDSFVAEIGGDGSFAVTGADDEPDLADQVESLFAEFTGVPDNGSTAEVHVGLIAIRTADVVTLLTAVNGGSGPDPDDVLATAMSKVADNQAS